MWEVLLDLSRCKDINGLNYTLTCVKVKNDTTISKRRKYLIVTTPHDWFSKPLWYKTITVAHHAFVVHYVIAIH